MNFNGNIEGPKDNIKEQDEKAIKDKEELKSECKNFLTEFNKGWELGIDIEDEDIAQLQEKLNEALKNLTPNQILAKTKNGEYKLLQDTFLKVDGMFTNGEINNDFKGKLEVDFRENSGASRYIGAGHLLPAHIRCIKINGRIGVRKTGEYRGIGYYDINTGDYLPIFTGCNIKIVSQADFNEISLNQDQTKNYKYTLNDKEINNVKQDEEQSLNDYIQNLDNIMYNEQLHEILNNFWDAACNSQYVDSIGDIQIILNSYTNQIEKLESQYIKDRDKKDILLNINAFLVEIEKLDHTKKNKLISLFKQNRVYPSMLTDLIRNRFEIKEKLSHDEARKIFVSRGIGIRPRVSFEGLQRSTIDGFFKLLEDGKNMIKIQPDILVITSAVDGNHASGQHSHENGYKLDIRKWTNPGILEYAQTQDRSPQNTSIGLRYIWQKDGYKYQFIDEHDHYDLAIIPV